MKKYLLFLAMAPLALAMSCSDDNDVPNVSGTYTADLMASTCGDITGATVIQDGNEIEIVFAPDANNTFDGLFGTVDEDGDFSVANDVVTCEGTFDPVDEFIVDCGGSIEACTVALTRN